MDKRGTALRASLDEATTRRLEHDLKLTMSERLARVHELCKQMSSVAGVAKRR